MLLDEHGLPIISYVVEKNKDDLYKQIAVNALGTMTNILVNMEAKRVPEKVMIEKCVWPILHEASRRFSAIRDDVEDVPLDGFEFMVK